jgi:hypothetical protein
MPASARAASGVRSVHVTPSEEVRREGGQDKVKMGGPPEIERVIERPTATKEPLP